MVWIDIVRIGMSVLADRQAPPRTWRQQVHLVRLDKHRSGLPIQPERNTREVEVVEDCQTRLICNMQIRRVVVTRWRRDGR